MNLRKEAPYSTSTRIIVKYVELWHNALHRIEILCSSMQFDSVRTFRTKVFVLATLFISDVTRVANSTSPRRKEVATMKFPKVIALVAVALTACGGGDSKSSSETDKVTNPPTTIEIETTTTPAPPTTVEVTTTTALEPEYAYEIVFVGPVEHDPVTGIHAEPIPTDGSIPLEAVNPVIPSKTLGEIMALDPGAEICLNGSVLEDDGTFSGANVVYLGTGLTSYLDPQTGETVEYVGIHVDYGMFTDWADAARSGVIPSQDGVTWATDKSVTLGACSTA